MPERGGSGQPGEDELDFYTAEEMAARWGYAPTKQGDYEAAETAPRPIAETKDGPAADVKLRPATPTGEAVPTPSPQQGRKRQERLVAEAHDQVSRLDAAEEALARAVGVWQGDAEAASDAEAIVRPAVPEPTEPKREHLLRRIVAKTGELADKAVTKGGEKIRKGAKEVAKTTVEAVKADAKGAVDMVRSTQLPRMREQTEIDRRLADARMRLNRVNREMAEDHRSAGARRMMGEVRSHTDRALRDGASSISVSPYSYPGGEGVDMGYEMPDGSSGGFSTHVNDGDYTSEDWLKDRRVAAQEAHLREQQRRRHPETRSREARRDPVTGRVRPLDIEDLPVVAGASDPPRWSRLDPERRGPAGPPRSESRSGRSRGSGWADDPAATFESAMDEVGETPGSRAGVYRGAAYTGPEDLPLAAPAPWRGAASGEASGRPGARSAGGDREERGDARRGRGSSHGGPGDHAPGHGGAGDHGPGHGGGHGSGHGGGEHGGHDDHHAPAMRPGEGPYAEPTITSYDPETGEVITNPRYRESVDINFIETEINELRTPDETGGVSIGGELITDKQVELVDRFCEKYGVDDWKDIKAAVYADTHLGDRPRRPDAPKRGILRMPPWAVFTELPRCIWEDHAPIKTLDRSKQVAFGLFSTNVDDVFLLSVVETSQRRNRKSGESEISGLVAAYAVRGRDRESALEAARAFAKRQKSLVKGIIRDPGHTFDTHAKLHEGDNALMAAGVSGEAGPTVLPGEIEYRADGTVVYDRTMVWSDVDQDEIKGLDPATADGLGDLPNYRTKQPGRGVKMRGDRGVRSRGAYGLGPTGSKRWSPTGPDGGTGAAGDGGGLGGPTESRGPRLTPIDGGATPARREPTMAFGVGDGSEGTVWRLRWDDEPAAAAAPAVPVRPAEPVVPVRPPEMTAPAVRPPVDSGLRRTPVRPPRSPEPVTRPVEATDGPRSTRLPSEGWPGMPAIEDRSSAPVRPAEARTTSAGESGGASGGESVAPRAEAAGAGVEGWPDVAAAGAVRPSAYEAPLHEDVSGASEGSDRDGAERQGGGLLGAVRRAARGLNERMQPVLADEAEQPGASAVEEQAGRAESASGGFRGYSATRSGERGRPMTRPEEEGGDEIEHRGIDIGDAGADRSGGAGADRVVEEPAPAEVADEDYSELKTSDDFVAAANRILGNSELSRAQAQTELDRLMQEAEQRRPPMTFPVIDGGEQEKLTPQQYLMHRLTDRRRGGGEGS